MVDLKNRKYKEIVAYEPDDWVCFEMENGLAYIVLLQSKKIMVRVYADSFLKFDPYCESGTDIDAKTKAAAVEILQTASLPEYSGQELQDLSERVDFKSNEEHR